MRLQICKNCHEKVNVENMWQCSTDIFECKDEKNCSLKKQQFLENEIKQKHQEKVKELEKDYLIVQSNGEGNAEEQLETLNIDISDLKKDDVQYFEEKVRYHLIDSKDFKQRFYFDLINKKWDIIISKTYFDKSDLIEIDDDDVEVLENVIENGENNIVNQIAT